MMNEGKADYVDLVDVWWKTAEVFEVGASAEPGRVNWHASVFERILIQCGWSVQEWNDMNTSKSNSGSQ